MIRRERASCETWSVVVRAVRTVLIPKGRKRFIELINSQQIADVVTDHRNDGDVLSAIAALPERQRSAIVLRYVADLPQGEVAERMDIAVGTASATLSQARSKLRTTLNEGESS